MIQSKGGYITIYCAVMYNIGVPVPEEDVECSQLWYLSYNRKIIWSTNRREYLRMVHIYISRIKTYSTMYSDTGTPVPENIRDYIRRISSCTSGMRYNLCIRHY